MTTLKNRVVAGVLGILLVRHSSRFFRSRRRLLRVVYRPQVPEPRDVSLAVHYEGGGGESLQRTDLALDLPVRIRVDPDHSPFVQPPGSRSSFWFRVILELHPYLRAVRRAFRGFH